MPAINTLNPNFPVPADIVAELDNSYGEGNYTPLICWGDYNDASTYFVVLKRPSLGREVIDMVRFFKMYQWHHPDHNPDSALNRSSEFDPASYTWAMSRDVEYRT